MIAGLLLLTQAATASIATLDDYLRLDTGKPSWSVGPKTLELADLRLNGLTWQGDVWRHEIVIAGSGLNSDVSILNLTGDRIGSSPIALQASAGSDCPMSRIEAIQGAVLSGHGA